jgi:hypothetical protein
MVLGLCPILSVWDQNEPGINAGNPARESVHPTSPQMRENVPMTRFLSLALFSSALLQAQGTAPLIADAKQVFAGVKTNVVKLAEKMPEDSYSFRASPDIRTFGELMAHIADAQTRMCSMASGETKQANAASKKTKAEIVAALKESVATCDSAWDSITPDNALQMIKFRNTDRTKIGTLIYNTVHSNEEYGYGAVYLRVKGIVPPSSEK